MISRKELLQQYFISRDINNKRPLFALYEEFNELLIDNNYFRIPFKAFIEACRKHIKGYELHEAAKQKFNEKHLKQLNISYDEPIQVIYNLIKLECNTNHLEYPKIKDLIVWIKKINPDYEDSLNDDF